MKKQRFKEAADKIAGAQDIIKKLETFYTKLEDFERVAQAINYKTIDRLNSVLQQMVISNYPAENIHVKSGDLLKAVSNSYITIDKKGILKVHMGAGLDKQVYVRAGFFHKMRDWYTLTSGQKNSLMTKFSEIWIAECNKWVVKKSREAGL